MNKEEIAYNKGYRVLINGDAINNHGRKLKGWKPYNGYHVIYTWLDKKRFVFTVHRLQAYQKYGQEMYKEGIQVRHLNNIKLDNSYNNIAIGTASQNMMDCPKDDRIKRAKNASKYAFKHDKVKIKEYHKECKSYKKTMIKFDISSKGTLHHILNKR